MLEVLLDSGWGPQVKKVLFVCPSLLQKHSYLYLFILFISFKSTNTYICLSQSLTKAHISIFVSPGLSSKYTYLHIFVCPGLTLMLKYLCPSLSSRHTCLYLYAPVSHQSTHIYICWSWSLVKSHLSIFKPTVSL